MSSGKLSKFGCGFYCRGSTVRERHLIVELLVDLCFFLLNGISLLRAEFEQDFVFVWCCPRGDKSSYAPAVRESVAACGQGLKLVWEVWEFFLFEEAETLGLRLAWPRSGS